jgi:nitroimidazol reductase NimA-like FMN-containing flavoprotein (pyridoxamine 5'-phosphate oxidase superfamily)
MPTTKLGPQAEHRLQTEHNIWLATVRSDHTPHLVPIWFVWVGGKIYLCTGADSVKVRNLLTNPDVSLALEDGSLPVVIEGRAQPIGSAPGPVVDAFKEKYDWNIVTDTEYNQVVEVKPKRIRT